MNLGVLGLWHLGIVTAACTAAADVATVGIDDNALTINHLRRGDLPLFEPGLKELVVSGIASGILSFTTDASALADRDVIWICHDTPVDEEDRADVDGVVQKIEAVFIHLRDGATVLVSAQLPVGTIARLERSFTLVAAGRHVSFACSPENLRLGRAIDIFRNPGRIIVGVRDARTRAALSPLLSRFCDELIWMGVESAEMAKHALNGFLALSVTFTNELAVICEHVGASAKEVEAALRSEPRVGKGAYVRPGPAFAGGTLARDVQFLSDLSREHRLDTPLIGSIIASNQAHRQWSISQLRRRLAPLAGKAIAVLGLSYKPGTDAIRRSMAIELLQELIVAHASVRAFDPAVSVVPPSLDGLVKLTTSPKDAMSGAEAAVIATEWPQFRELTADDFVGAMSGRLLIDPAGFLPPSVVNDPRLTVISIGRST